MASKETEFYSNILELEKMRKSPFLTTKQKKEINEQKQALISESSVFDIENKWTAEDLKIANEVIQKVDDKVKESAKVIKQPVSQEMVDALENDMQTAKGGVYTAVSAVDTAIKAKPAVQQIEIVRGKIAEASLSCEVEAKKQKTAVDEKIKTSAGGKLAAKGAEELKKNIGDSNTTCSNSFDTPAMAVRNSVKSFEEIQKAIPDLEKSMLSLADVSELGKIYIRKLKAVKPLSQELLDKVNTTVISVPETLAQAQKVKADVAEALKSAPSLDSFTLLGKEIISSKETAAKSFDSLVKFVDENTVADKSKLQNSDDAKGSSVVQNPPLDPNNPLVNPLPSGQAAGSQAVSSGSTSTSELNSDPSTVIQELMAQGTSTHSYEL